jgi:hypothetical protein
MGDTPIVQSESPYKALYPIVLAENIQNINTRTYDIKSDLVKFSVRFSQLFLLFIRYR